MALPDFWLPREIQERRVAPDAQIMEVLSRSFPQLHMWVMTNAVWLLLLYFLGLEMAHWLNAPALVSEALIEVQFWAEQDYGVTNTGAILIAMYIVILGVMVLASLAMMWSAVMWSETTYIASLVAVPVMGLVMGVLYAVINIKIVAGIQTGLGFACVIAFFQAEMRKHMAIALFATLGWLLWKLVLDTVNVQDVWKLVFFSLAIPVLVAVQLRNILSELFEGYLREVRDQYTLPLFVIHAVNVYLTLPLLYSLWKMLKRAGFVLFLRRNKPTENV